MPTPTQGAMHFWPQTYGRLRRQTIHSLLSSRSCHRCRLPPFPVQVQIDRVIPYLFDYREYFQLKKNRKPPNSSPEVRNRDIRIIKCI